MRVLATLCSLLVTLASGFAGAQTISADVPPPRPAWNTKPDFGELREAWGRREDFEKLCERNRPNKPFSEAVKEKKFNAASEMALLHLASCPVDAQMHLWAADALRAAKREPESNRHLWWFLSLTDAALSSGDGSSAAKPIETISVREEYAVLARLRLRPVDQALEGPSKLDRVSATTEAGEQRVLYFNPRLHWLRFAKSFPSAASEPARTAKPVQLDKPDPQELIALLRSRNFAELDARMGKYQSAYEAESEAEWELVRAFAVFERVEPDLEPAFDAWIAALPRSYSAHVASGAYFHARAWITR
jgi:hypothetical protein